MQKRLPFPGLSDTVGDFRNCKIIRQATMVVDIINKQHTGICTNRQQIERSVPPVIVLQNQPGTNTVRQFPDVAS